MNYKGEYHEAEDGEVLTLVAREPRCFDLLRAEQKGRDESGDRHKQQEVSDAKDQPDCLVDNLALWGFCGQPLPGSGSHQGHQYESHDQNKGDQTVGDFQIR